MLSEEDEATATEILEKFGHVVHISMCTDWQTDMLITKLCIPNTVWTKHQN